MSYYMDLMREISTLCLAMSLNNAESFVQDIDAKKLTAVQYVDLLGAAAGRIGGCAAYEPAQAAATAARVAVRAAGVYDHASGDQTIAVTKMVTRYLRYAPADFRRTEEAPGLASVLALWISVWKQAESAIDPQWRQDEIFPSFDPGPTSEVFKGQKPSDIADPALRARYEDYLAQRAVFLQRVRDQTLLRRALDEAREDYVAYAAQLATVPGMRASLDSAAAEVADPALEAALRGNAGGSS